MLLPIKTSEDDRLLTLPSALMAIFRQMKITISKDDRSKRSDEMLKRLTGRDELPKDPASLTSILIQAGQSQSDVWRFLNTIGVPGFSDCGTLPPGAISASGDDWPTFSAGLIAGLKRNAAMAGVSASAETTGARKPTINSRMLDVLSRRPESKEWSVTQWTDYLECGRASVAATPIWKQLQATRNEAKAAFMERNRKQI